MWGLFIYLFHIKNVLELRIYEEETFTMKKKDKFISFEIFHTKTYTTDKKYAPAIMLNYHP